MSHINGAVICQLCGHYGHQGAECNLLNREQGSGGNSRINEHVLRQPMLPACPSMSINSAGQTAFVQGLSDWHRDVANWSSEMGIFIAQFEELRRLLEAPKTIIFGATSGLTVTFEAPDSPEMNQIIRDTLAQARVRVDVANYSLNPIQQQASSGVRVGRPKSQAKNDSIMSKLKIENKIPVSTSRGYQPYTSDPFRSAASTPAPTSATKNMIGGILKQDEDELEMEEDSGEIDLNSLGFDPRTDPRYMHYPLPIVAARSDMLYGPRPELPLSEQRKDYREDKSKVAVGRGYQIKAATPAPTNVKVPVAKTRGRPKKIKTKAASPRVTSGRVTKPRKNAAGRKTATSVQSVTDLTQSLDEAAKITGGTNNVTHSKVTVDTPVQEGDKPQDEEGDKDPTTLDSGMDPIAVEDDDGDVDSTAGDVAQPEVEGDSMSITE